MTRAARSHRMGAIALGAILPVVATVIASPAGASAAVTRPVQAVDGVGTHYWVPNALNAQQGDSIEWRFTQPGNSAAAQHDVWIVPPGGSATQVGAQFQGATAQTAVSQLGTYQFYCSIHGGLTPGGMNGTITVGADDPGPPTDPGQAWLTAPPPSTGPQPAVNPFVLPEVYESGDTTPPSLSIRSADGVRRGVRLRVAVSEPSTLTVRLEDNHRKLLATRRLRVPPGTRTFTVKTRSRIDTSRARVRITARDDAQLETSPRLARVWIGN
jgi:plastocyanin